MIKLLIIEDDPNCVLLIRRAVKTLCSEILDTGRLSEALLMIDETFDAVWIDLALDDSSAYNTVNTIPQIRNSSPAATLIVVSGYGDSYRDRAIEMGADVYASKIDIGDFSSDAIASLFVQASVRAMMRGVNSTRVLEQAVEFFGQRVCALKDTIAAEKDTGL